MLAIIRTGGKQYLVSEGEKVKIETIEGEVGAVVPFEALYIGDGTEAVVGTPVLENAVVEGKIVGNDRHDKVWGIKYKPKKRYKVKFGHQQSYTEIEIVKISKEAGKKTPAKKEATQKEPVKKGSAKKASKDTK